MRSAALLALAALLTSAVAPARAHADVPADDEPGGMAVSVTIPAGSLSLTPDEPVPAGSSCSVALTVTDTRAGNLGFEARVDAPGAVTLVARQVAGNAMRPDDVRVHATGNEATATYPAGLGLGSVRLVATSSAGCPSITLQ